MFEAIPSKRSNITKGKFRGRLDRPLVSSYKKPPFGDINIEDVEQHAADRVQVLREIAALEFTNEIGHKGHERIRNVIKKLLPLDPKGMNVDEFNEAIKKDIVSHWICRLAFCGSEDDKEWFITQEMALLRWRLFEYNDMYSDFFSTFLKEAELEYDTILDEEFEELQDKLLLMAMSRHSKEKMNGRKGRKIDPSIHVASSYFKVPFEQVLSLVSKNSVFLKNGYAYVHKNDVLPLIMSDFKENLNDGLIRASKIKVRDNRIPMVLDGLTAGYLGLDYASRVPKGEIDLTQIDAVSKQHFPLCMRSMHEKLRTKHHLRHGARMHYGLFLKGIGVTLDQAMIFWKSEFLRVMDEDSFKEHAYTIRHNYGKEGRRADYTPYSCVKIINSGPSTIDDHGCPFKHFSADYLVEQLMAYGRSNTEIRAVMNDVRKGNYGLACKKYFQFTHLTQDTSEVVITHPNEYYNISVKGTSFDPSKVKKKEE